MDSRKLIETQEETSASDSGLPMDGVVEMGDASVETKGIARGIEWGFTPLN